MQIVSLSSSSHIAPVRSQVKVDITCIGALWRFNSAGVFDDLAGVWSGCGRPLVGEDVGTEGPGRSSCARHSVGVDEVLRIGKGPLSFDVCLRRYGNVSMLKKAPGAILEAVTVKAERCSAHVSAENRASRRKFCESPVQRRSSWTRPLRTISLRGRSDEYVYGPSGVPIEQVSESSGAATYLYTDQLGSVTMEADQSGSVIGTQSYNPYGTLASSTGTDSTPFGFAGGYTDPTGLIYLINRYYDPATGQFVSVDPIVQTTQQSYAYAADNPVNVDDPLGLAGKCKKVIGGVLMWVSCAIVPPKFPPAPPEFPPPTAPPTPVVVVTIPPSKRKNPCPPTKKPPTTTPPPQCYPFGPGPQHLACGPGPEIPMPLPGGGVI